jgi:hypothetical protein
MTAARWVAILLPLLSSAALAAAPATRPVIVDLTWSDDKESKPQPLIDGMVPGYWTAGNFSRGDGTRSWEDPAFADTFVREAAKREQPGERVDPRSSEPVRPIPPPWTSRFVVVDFEPLARDDMDATVRQVVTAIRARAPGWKLTPFAWRPGWPDAKYPGPMGEVDFTLEVFNSACRPANERTPEDEKRHQWMRQRLREQRDIARLCGVISVSGQFCEPAQVDRDLLAHANRARLLREEYPTTELAIIVWGGYVFDSSSLVTDDTIRKQLDMAFERYDYVLVWGPWRDSKSVARLAVERAKGP